MTYILIFLLSVSFISASSCTQTGAINAGSSPPDNSNISKPLAKEEAPETPVTECNICNFDHVSYKGELNRGEIEGLMLALNDEYMATAIYEQVNRDFNNPRPFANIVRAERQHADRLKSLFAKYGVAIPENPWADNVKKYSSVNEACRAGIDGEIMNRDLYARLFRTTERQDIIATYKDLQRASEENHLPAFERCSNSESRQGRGPGPGNGRGPRGN